MIDARVVTFSLLVLQTSLLSVSTRYSKTSREGEQGYQISSLVFLSEVIKLPVLFLALFWQLKQEKSGRKILPVMFNDFKKNLLLFFLTAAPSFLYTAQNFLTLQAMATLPTHTFQVTLQLKLLSTALFSSLLLGKKVNQPQWLTLLVLSLGVLLIQFPSSFTQGFLLPSIYSADSSSSGHPIIVGEVKLAPPSLQSINNDLLRDGNSTTTLVSKLVSLVPPTTLAKVEQITIQQDSTVNLLDSGLACAILASLTSGLAGTLLEGLLFGRFTLTSNSVESQGNEPASFWLRTFNLNFWTFVFASVTLVYEQGLPPTFAFSEIYDSLACLIIFLQGAGSILAAMVVKHVGSILKTIAASLSIVLSAGLSYLFSMSKEHPFLSVSFIFGLVLVVVSSCAFVALATPPKVKTS